MRMTPLTLNFSLNLAYNALRSYQVVVGWTDEMPVLVQDRRGQRDPRKRLKVGAAIIMARVLDVSRTVRSTFLSNTASRASGPVVKVAAASRANTPVRKCGSNTRSAGGNNLIFRATHGSYTTEGRVVDMVRGSLMHAARLGCWDRSGHRRFGPERMRVQPAVHVHDAHDRPNRARDRHPTVSDDALVTPGTLTVALDTSDAPQAMQDADGNLTGYAVDAARAPCMPHGSQRLPLSMRPRPIPYSAIKGRHLHWRCQVYGRRYQLAWHLSVRCRRRIRQEQ